MKKELEIYLEDLRSLEKLIESVRRNMEHTSNIKDRIKIGKSYDRLKDTYLEMTGKRYDKR